MLPRHKNRRNDRSPDWKRAGPRVFCQETPREPARAEPNRPDPKTEAIHPTGFEPVTFGSVVWGPHFDASTHHKVGKRTGLWEARVFNTTLMLQQTGSPHVYHALHRAVCPRALVPVRVRGPGALRRAPPPPRHARQDAAGTPGGRRRLPHHGPIRPRDNSELAVGSPRPGRLDPADPALSIESRLLVRRLEGVRAQP